VSPSAGSSELPGRFGSPWWPLDEGESTTDTLVRELAEELGIGVESPGPPWVTLHADGRELYVFLVDRWQGEPHNVALDEHDDIRWASIG
jgi:8-oxo-dGTP diphosphatase